MTRSGSDNMSFLDITLYVIGRRRSPSSSRASSRSDEACRRLSRRRRRRVRRPWAEDFGFQHPSERIALHIGGPWTGFTVFFQNRRYMMEKAGRYGAGPNKLWGNLSIIMETGSPPGNNCDHLRCHQEDMTCTPSVLVYAGALPEGIMKVCTVCGEQDPSDSLMQIVSRALLRHILRFNMTTSHGDVSTNASVCVVRTDYRPSWHDVTPCSPACTSCTDMPSASSSQHFMFGKSSALAEHRLRGTMASASMPYQRTAVAAFRGKAMYNLDIFESLPLSKARHVSSPRRSTSMRAS